MFAAISQFFAMITTFLNAGEITATAAEDAAKAVKIKSGLMLREAEHESRMRNAEMDKEFDLLD